MTNKLSQTTSVFNVRGLYDKFMNLCYFFVACLWIFMQCTEQCMYNNYVFNIKVHEFIIQPYYGVVNSIRLLVIAQHHFVCVFRDI